MRPALAFLLPFLWLLLLGTAEADAQTCPQYRDLVVEAPGQGTPLDPADLIRAENPEQDFAVVLATENGATRAREGESVRFRVRSDRSGYLTLLSMNEQGHITLLYPNAFARGQRVEAGQDVFFPAGADFYIRVRPPFGREYVKAIVTPQPLVVEDVADRIWSEQSYWSTDGAPCRDGGHDLAGYDRSLWGTAALYFVTMGRGETAGAPVDVPEAPPDRYGTAAAPLQAWAERFAAVSDGGVAPDEIIQPIASRPTEVPEHDGSIVVVYHPLSSTRSFGQSQAGGGLFNRIRRIDPREDSRDMSGTRSLFGTYGLSFDEILGGLGRDADVLAAIPNYTFRLQRARPSGPLVEPSPSASGGQPAPPAAARGTRTYWEFQWPLHNAYYRSSQDRVDIRWREALRAYQRAEPVVVAVMDTGIRFDNPHLSPVLWRNPGEVPDNGFDDDGNGFADDVYGWDFVQGDADPSDPSATDSHGTQVASVIGGQGETLFAMAPDVRLMPIRVIDETEVGLVDDVIEGIRYAAQNGARVVNLALNSTNEERERAALVRVLDRVFEEAEALGVLIVIPAGNDGADSRTSYSYPARVRRSNTLTVAALTLEGDLADFSNRGPHVDLAAPGTAIVSHAGAGDAVVVAEGTSMAVAYVSALAAMLFAQHPGWTPAQVKARILATVQPIPGLDVESGGVLNAAGALQP